MCPLTIKAEDKFEQMSSASNKFTGSEADWGEIRELGAPRQETVPAHFLSWPIHRAPTDTLRLPAGKCPARLLGQALQANSPTPTETLSRASASASQVVSPIDGGGRILVILLLR
jgi:hypothetical protein